MAESEQDIVEGTALTEGTEIKTEYILDENVIHPDLQVPTVEHTYNLWQRRNPHMDYTNRYEFKSTIIHCAITQV